MDIKFALYCVGCFLEACYSKYRTGLSKCSVPGGGCLIYVTDDEAGRMLVHFSQLPRILEPRRQNCTEFEVAVSSPKLREEIKSAYEHIKEVHLVSEGAGLKELLAVANSRSLQNLLLPLTSTATAASILAGVCKGRGEWIRWDGAVQKECEGVQVGNPLRDISDREVQLYCAQLRGQYLFNTALSTGAGDSTQVKQPKTIDELTKAFMSRLDQENPGTANVVLRTIDKIDSVRLNHQHLKHQKPCQGCLVPAGTDYCYSCTSNL